MPKKNDKSAAPMKLHHLELAHFTSLVQSETKFEKYNLAKEKLQLAKKQGVKEEKLSELEADLNQKKRDSEEAGQQTAEKRKMLQERRESFRTQGLPRTGSGIWSAEKRPAIVVADESELSSTDASLRPTRSSR